jgi:hypothetical protein
MEAAMRQAGGRHNSLTSTALPLLPEYDCHERVPVVVRHLQKMTSRTKKENEKWKRNYNYPRT